MKNHNFRRVALLATLPLGLIVNAQAEPNAAVGTRDLDLRRAQDVAVLYERIERSAARVCNDASSPWDARRNVHVRECTAAAVADAVAHANVSALTALHESKVRAARLAQNRDE